MRFYNLELANSTSYYFLIRNLLGLCLLCHDRIVYSVTHTLYLFIDNNNEYDNWLI